MRTGLILATSLLALAGCSGGDASGNNAGTEAAGAAPIQPPPALNVATPQGSIDIRPGAAAPAGASDGLPLYPGADTGQGINVSGGAGRGAGGIRTFSTADTPQQVIAFYAPAVVRAGYSVANQMDLGQTATLSARRGAGEAVNVTATRIGAVTQVQIIAGAGR